MSSLDFADPGSDRPLPAFFAGRRRFRNAFAFLVLGLSLLGGTAATAAGGAQAAPLDLNRASAEELEALPGIGPVKAAAILAVRDAQGGFASFDELEEVRGVGPALVEKLRPLVVLGDRK
ncbi:MAG: ComEA family DNA-binding protein, partial [Myxococcota bacterium]